MSMSEQEPDPEMMQIGQEMGMLIWIKSLFAKDPSEEERVKSYIAKSLGFGQALDQMTSSQTEAIDAAFSKAVDKAVKAGAMPGMFYKTAEQAADAMIKAVAVNKDKGSKENGL
jgi:hypothetical protein